MTFWDYLDKHTHSVETVMLMSIMFLFIFGIFWVSRR